MKVLILPLLFLVLTPDAIQAQHNTLLELNTMSNPLMRSDPISRIEITREERCLRTGRLIGTLAGGAMGLNILYLGTQGEIDGPYWKAMAMGIPGMILGAYAGSRGTEWLTGKILAARRGPGGSALRGVVYGFLDGAVTGIATMVPILGIGCLTGSIDFNRDLNLLEVLGTATLGGAAFGGFFGATAGLVIGPGISVYMKF